MALTDLTRISTSGIATGSTIDAPILRKDVSFRGSQVGVTSALFDSSENELNLKDNVKLTFGNATNGDLRIYHDTSNGSYVKEAGPGALRIQGDAGVWIQSSSNNQDRIVTNHNGDVQLFYSGNKKLNTTSHGAVVTGILTATGFSGPLSNPSGISTFYDLRVTNNLTVEGTTSTLDTTLIGVDRVEVGANSNSIVGVAVTQSGTADIVNLFDGTKNVLTVTDTGDVGIGTNNPATELEVHGNSGGTIRLAKGGANRTTLLAGDTLGKIQFRSYDTSLNHNSYNGTYVEIETVAVTALGGPPGNNVRLDLKIADTDEPGSGKAITPVPALSILQGGKVGIGITNPNAMVQIISDQNAETNRFNSSNYHLMLQNDQNDTGEAVGMGFAISDDIDKVGGAILFERSGGGSAGSLQFYTNSDGASVTERLRIQSDGKVGVGITNPTKKFQINTTGTSGEGILLKATDNTYPAFIGDANRSAYDTFLVALQGYWNGNRVGEVTIESGSDTTNKDEGMVKIRTRNAGDSTPQDRLTVYHTGQTQVHSTTESSSTTTGSFIVSGGIGVAKKAYVGGDVLIADSTNSIYNDNSGGGINLKANGQIVNKKEATSESDPLVWLNDTGQTTNRTIVLAQDGTERGYLGLTGTSLSLGVNGGDRAVIDSSGRVIIGHNTSRYVAGGHQRLQVQNATSEGAHFIRTSNDNGAIILALAKSRSSAGAACIAGDRIGTLGWYPHDGTDCNHAAAEIFTEVATGIGGNDVPGALVFKTNPGQTTTEEAVRIDPNGNVQFGGVNGTGPYQDGNARNVIDLGSGTMNRGFGWGGSTGNYANIWTEYSSGDLNFAAGLRPTGSSQGYVSSYGGGALGRSGMELRLNGDILFRTAPSSTVANGSAVSTLEERLQIKSDGEVHLPTAGYKFTENNFLSTSAATVNDATAQHTNAMTSLMGSYHSTNNTDGIIDFTDYKASDWTILEVYGRVNPNRGGSGAYQDLFYMTIYKGIGYTYPNVVTAIFAVMHTPAARTMYSSGTSNSGNDGITAVWYNGSSESREFTYNNTNMAANYLRIKVPTSNFNTTHGCGFSARIFKRF